MRKIVLVWAIFAGMVGMPFLAHAEILITEIAWMGTTNSQYEEWVELYNDGDDVDVSGWKLVKSGGTTLFSMTGTISAGQYYVICRTTASLQNPLGGSCDEQGSFGGSGLNNTSDQVILKDADGATMDSADGTGGWPAGDSATKATMQWDGSGWVTADATPGAETAGSGETDDNEDNSDNESSNTSRTETSDSKEKIELIEPDPVYVAHMKIPDYGIAGVAVPIRAEVKKDGVMITKRGRFEWSMGDGAGFKFFRNTDTEHIFQYSGDYTIVLAYYSDVFRDEPDSIHRKKITIAPSSLSISGMTDDGGVILQNDSSRDIDLANWKIVSNGSEFIFPKYTTIARGAELAVSGKTIGFWISKSDVVIRNPNGVAVGRYGASMTHPLTPSSRGGIEQGAVAEAAASDSDWSPQSAGSQNHEKTNSFGIIWNENKWYILFGFLTLIVAVAYFATRLYASRSELEEVEELDYDIL